MSPEQSQEGGQVSSRAGRLQRHDDGVATFEPAVLPPTPPVRLDGRAHRALADAERALGQLSGQVAARPQAEHQVALACAREAVASCALDGSRVSLADLLWWQLDGARADRLRAPRGEVRIAANLAAQLQAMAAEPATPTPGQLLQRRHLADRHARLFRGVRGRDSEPGRLRDTVIWLGPAGSTVRTALYVPPHPETVAAHLEALQAWADSDPDLPPLAVVAVIAAQLESIHPFVDGNGRCARLLTVELLRTGHGPWPQLLCPSVLQRLQVADHFELLQRLRRQGDWEGWVLAFARRLRDAAEAALAGLVTAADELRAHQELVQDHEPTLVATALPLLRHLTGQPLVSVGRVAEVCQRTFANANQLVARLERLGLLREITGRRRHRRYLYVPWAELPPEEI